MNVLNIFLTFVLPISFQGLSALFLGDLRASGLFSRHLSAVVYPLSIGRV